MSERHNKVSIIGLGNIQDGDLGVACQILETLSLEPFEDSVKIFYAGEDSRYAGGWIYNVDLLIIVGEFYLGGAPGWINKWDYNVFSRFIQTAAGKNWRHAGSAGGDQGGSHGGAQPGGCRNGCGQGRGGR